MSNQPSAAVAYGSRTDVGLVRPHNEDSLVVTAPLFAVADGMGGHEAGEVASEIAVQTLSAQAPTTADAEELGKAVVAANQAVIQGATTGIGKPGMGTTLTAAILEGTHLVIAQVGDSRAYLLHNGSLSRLTRDHSLVARLVENGEITEEEARWHPQRSVITRALGSEPNTIPDLYDFNLLPGDRLMLCSDGLYSMVADEDLAEIMREHEDPQVCADALVAAALEAGGHDNVTTIVVDVLEGALDTTQPIKAVKRRRTGLLIGIIAAFVCVVLAACAGTYSYAQHQAFLIEEEGTVAVYKGLMGDIGPLHLAWLDTTTTIKASELYEAIPSLEQSLPGGIACASLDEAQEMVAYYEQAIADYKKDHSATNSGSATGTSGQSGSKTDANSNGSQSLADAISNANSNSKQNNESAGSNNGSSNASSSGANSSSSSNNSSNSNSRANSGSSSSNNSGTSSSGSSSHSNTVTNNSKKTN